jgi:uncharacterized membrane protein YccC
MTSLLPSSPISHALRVAVAASLCLVLADWFRLEHGSQAVLTAHMVMAQYPYTVYQKGIERIIGRGSGILCALVLLTLGANAPVLAFVLKLLALLVFFYVYFSGRLAYTFLSAGLYLAVIVEVGNANPAAAIPVGEELFLAIVIGVLMAIGVMWLTSAEHDLRIRSEGEPLLPLRGDFLSHSLMLVVTVALTQLATRLLDLPVGPALVSVTVLTVVPNLQALLRKGQLRIAGVVLAAVWGFASFLLLNYLPHFLLLLALLFLGMFVAAYITRVAGEHSYAGLQMGLVLPMILVVPPSQFSNLAPAVQRLEGIAAALVASVLVGCLWASFSRGSVLSPGANPPRLTGRGRDGSEIIEPRQ